MEEGRHWAATYRSKTQQKRKQDFCPCSAVQGGLGRKFRWPPCRGREFPGHCDTLGTPDNSPGRATWALDKVLSILTTVPKE